jgi:hypothetical protein
MAAGFVLFCLLFVDIGKVWSGGLTIAALSFTTTAIGFRLGLGFWHFLQDRANYHFPDPRVRTTIGSAVRYALIPAFLLWLGLSSAHAVPYTIASSAASPQASGLFAQTVTNPATLNLTAGDTLLVFINECGDTNCATTNGPQPSSITVSAGAIGA